MLTWIVESSLKLRFLVLSAAAALVLFGAVQLRKAPVDVFPEFAPPVVEVQTEAIGLSAEEVESMITFSLEELLSGVPWLESTRSRSVTGLSSVLLIFKRGTDVMKARQMVQERLALAYTLPNVAAPPVILQPLSATSRFMMVGVSSDKIDATELSLLARWTMKPKLVGVPGVSNVSVWGQRLRQLHVHFDPERLRNARVSQDDIITATGDALWVSPLSFLRASSPGSGGWIDNPNQRLGVEHSMPIETPEDMAKIAVTSPHLLLTGRSMALGDIAETTFAHSPVIGDAFVNKGNGLLLVIEKFPGANTLEVTRGVEQALAELKRGLPGVKVDDSVFKLATYVDESITNLNRAIAIGGVLVLLTLLAFLSNWRSAVVAAISLPLSLLAALVVLHLAGATLNTMIIAGLVVALAVVIDSAVVDVHRLQQRLRARTAADPGPLALVVEATLQTQRTMLYATLIVLLAASPLFFLGGVSGAFFEPLAIAYVLAVAASTVVALTVTPALTLMLNRQPPTSEASSNAPVEVTWRGRIEQRYDGLLGRALQSQGTMFAAVGVLAVAAAVAWPLLGKSMLPALKEHQLLVNWTTPPGTSHAETWRITSRACKELQALPGVTNVGAHVGRAVTGDQVVGINSSQIWVSLDPKADRDTTLAAIRTTIDGYPGVDHNVQSYLRDKVGEVLTGQSKAIVVRLYGPKRDVLNQKAEEVRSALAGIEGLVDLSAEDQIGEPHVQVKVDLAAASKANVKPGDVRRSAASIFSGLVVGYLFKEQRIYEVVVWGAPETRENISNLRDLWVEKSDRSHTRLGDVASVNVVGTPTVIRHERFAPYVDVVANVSGRNPSAVADEVREKLAKVPFPLEYHPELLGEYAERIDARNRTLGVALVAMIGILLLLQACFQNWRLALIGLAAMLGATAGGVLAAAMAGGVVTLGSIVGLLAVLGIAARQNVQMIGSCQALEGAADSLRAAARGHLMPILTSSVATIAALLPILFGGAIPGFEIVRPTAIVIAGGLLASTLLTLFVVPALIQRAGAAARRAPDLALAVA
jgi:CzcA family heavy metal efflux pump